MKEIVVRTHKVSYLIEIFERIRVLGIVGVLKSCCILVSNYITKPSYRRCFKKIIKEAFHPPKIGIRTPWTMSSETVWKKTHAIGAKLFKFAGLFALSGIIFPDYAIIPIIVPVIVASAYAVVYSYFEFQKETKHKAK